MPQLFAALIVFVVVVVVFLLFVLRLENFFRPKLKLKTLISMLS